MEKVFYRINTIMKSCETALPFMPPTQLFNEGWMLRLILSWLSSLELAYDEHKLAIPQDCRWYSEALLPPAFQPERRGDKAGETWTHADGVIGNFEIGNGAKGNLGILPGAKHFVVIEAKMFSKLSTGVKNANYFNQAARNVACIAKALETIDLSLFRALGFYVVAPSSQIELRIFEEFLRKDCIRNLVEKRASEYGRDKDKWFSNKFLPVLEKIEIKTISWEDLIEFIMSRDREADQLRSFYVRCLAFNKQFRQKIRSSST